jgi:hypothetical protein
VQRNLVRGRLTTPRITSLGVSISRVSSRSRCEGDELMAHRRLLPMLALLVLLTSSASGQGSALTSEQTAPFMGTWVFTMTEPEAFKGTQQTVRIWAKNSVVGASVQVGKFPATDATGIFKDGDMLVITISHEAQPGLRENGAPIWAIISMIRDGDTMKTAQMLERSQTIKRGLGKKQQD